MSDQVAIYPADQLHAWLDGHRSDPATLDEIELRLPVKVTLSANKMEIERATIGDRADALAIKVDDRTLNVPIVGKLPMFYGEGASEGMLWLTGLWHGGEAKEFQVTRVLGKADASVATQAEIVK